MTKTGRARQIFKPEFQFGLGGVPLGNEFEVVTEEGARETLEASWTAGVRYFDVSPWARARRTTIWRVPAPAAARQLSDFHQSRKTAQSLAA